jgi:hypothetical protein
MVSTALVDQAFLPVAKGFAEWIRLRASQIGIAVEPGRTIRQSSAVGQEQLMAEAAERGVGNALLLDLRSRKGNPRGARSPACRTLSHASRRISSSPRSESSRSWTLVWPKWSRK